VAHPNEALVEQIHGSFASGQHPSVNLFAPDVIRIRIGGSACERKPRRSLLRLPRIRRVPHRIWRDSRILVVFFQSTLDRRILVASSRIDHGSKTGRGQRESEKEHYAWAQYQADIERLADEIRNDSRHSLTTIYGIPRGGLVVAVSLSQILGLPIALSAEKITPATLVVDDIADSGKTLDNICRRIGFRPMVVTLYYNPSSVQRPDRFIRTKTKWVVFRWETELSSRYDQTSA